MIDPIRFIGNNSSGKQAIAIAKVLKQMDAQIHFVAGNIALPIPLSNQEITMVESANEMFEVVKNNLVNIDIFIGCAAVADFKIKNISHQKIKKTHGIDGLHWQFFLYQRGASPVSAIITVPVFLNL